MENTEKKLEPEQTKPQEPVQPPVQNVKVEITKKKKKGVIRSFFGSIFNVREWVSYDEISYNGKWILESLKLLFSKPKKLNQQELNETFSDAATRLQLSEEDIASRTKHFLMTSVLYFAIAVLLFAYEIYLIFVGAPFLSLIMNLALIALMTSYAYRENFWYMQMKKRKLGCTFDEWRNYILGRTQK